MPQTYQSPYLTRPGHVFFFTAVVAVLLLPLATYFGFVVYGIYETHSTPGDPRHSLKMAHYWISVLTTSVAFGSLGACVSSLTRGSVARSNGVAHSADGLLKAWLTHARQSIQLA
jgi:hypothetical protein